MAEQKFKTLSEEWLAVADECLDDAEFLMAQGRSTRSILNRAYFAMFYAMRAMLLTQGENLIRPLDAIKCFDGLVKTGWIDKELSQMLHDAYELRLENDYRQVFPSTQMVTDGVVADARHFVNSARDLVYGPPESSTDS